MVSLTQAGFPRPFGDYLLLSSFGRGGMGEVFLAKRTAFEGIDRLCVIKTLRAELTGDPEYVNRFLDEARVVVQLHHANISQVFDAGTLGSDYFLAMEYVSGTNVRDLVNRLHAAGSSLEPGIALFIISDTLDALAYAHRLVHPMTGERLSIIHRDVSPHNVMVSFEGEVKLIDFGLAESTLKQEHTESALVLGKVAYMSPEQARGEDVDASCDQFAMAVMTYELLAHERFYGNLRTPDIWKIVGHGGYVPRLLSALDVDVARLLTRAWDPDPSARFPSCEAFREALDDYRAVRYPRIGKKQARSLMQGLYQQRILDERKLLLTVAELTSPSGQASPSVTSSGVRAHEAATSAPHAEAGESTQLPSEPGEPSSTVSRQEQAFMGERTVTASAASAVTEPSSMPTRPLALAASVGLLAVAAVSFALVFNDAAPAPTQPPVETEGGQEPPAPPVGEPPADTGGAQEAPTGAAVDAGVAPAPRMRRGRGRLGRPPGRRGDPTTPPQPAQPPREDPVQAPEAPPEVQPDPPPDKPVVRVVKTHKAPPPEYSGHAALERLQRCDLGCAKLWKSKAPDPAALEKNKLALVFCARKCDGWNLIQGQWVGPE